MLKMEFLKRTYLFCSYAIKTLSIRINQLMITINIIKASAYQKLCLIKDIFGEKIDNPNKKMVVTITENKPTSVKHELILFCFVFDFGKNLIKEIPIPRLEIVVIIPITEIIVVAKPISSEENKRALIIQKKKPNPLEITAANIKITELLNKESFFNLRIKSFIFMFPNHPRVCKIPEYDEIQNK
jgi:hypothetical protein